MSVGYPTEELNKFRFYARIYLNVTSKYGDVRVAISRIPRYANLWQMIFESMNEVYNLVGRPTEDRKD